MTRYSLIRLGQAWGALVLAIAGIIGIAASLWLYVIVPIWSLVG